MTKALESLITLLVTEDEYSLATLSFHIQESLPLIHECEIFNTNCFLLLNLVIEFKIDMIFQT
jgi:hypothetical protein